MGAAPPGGASGGGAAGGAADSGGQGGPGAARRVRNLRLVHRRSTPGADVLGPIPLKPGVMYVGRVPTNDIQLPSQLVSRRHAKLIFTDMGLTLHDLDSHNGVFVNGKKVRSTPVEVGDFVYFADVCCQVEVAEGSDAQDAFDVESSMNKSNLVSQVLKGEGADDPAVRNLATLIQATDLLLSADDERFFPEMVSRCRDLTEASLGVFIQRTEDGHLETPIILREGTAPRGEAPVSWAVVRKTIDESCVLFSRDTAADPLVPGDLLASGDAGAVMCVPVLVEGTARAAIYLMRPFAGEGFTDREVETVSAVAHLIGARMRGAGPQGGQAQMQAPDVEATGIRKVGHSTSEEDDQRSLEQQADSARARVAELEALVLSKTSTAEEAQRRVKDTEAELARLRGELEKRSESGEGASRRAVELEAKVEAQNAELAAARNDSAAAREELARATREAQRRADEVERAAHEIARIGQELEDARSRSSTALEELRGELSAAKEALAAASGGIAPEALAAATASLSPRLARRIQLLAAGNSPGDDLGAGLVTALCVGLSGLDSWSQSVSPGEASARMEAFCRAVADAAARHDGTLEQVLGQAHLLTFPGDAKGVRGALRCAHEVLQAVPLEATLGVQGGVHVGPAVLGFFGGPNAVYAQFGEAVAIARGACEYARPGSVYVTDKVRSVVGDDPRTVFIFAGPHLIRGFMNPFDLFQLGVAQGEKGQGG